jgi:LysR family transcriptional regulator, nod-box dependent transcriptional activator
MVRTAVGTSLAAPVGEILRSIRAAITRPTPSRPDFANRLIRIMASDYATEVLLAPAISGMIDRIPAMRFEIQTLDEDPLGALEAGTVDIAIILGLGVSQEFPSQTVLEDDYVVVGWAENPVMSADLTVEAYFDAMHVTARFAHSKVVAFDDWFVRKYLRLRRNVISVPNLSLLPSFVIGSDRLAVMHRRHAALLAQRLPLAIRELPFEIPPISEVAQWHSARDDDPVLRWVIDRMAEAGGVAGAIDNTIAPDTMAHSFMLQTKTLRLG